MLNPSARVLPSEGRGAHHFHVTDIAPKVARFVARRAIRDSLLDCYLEGWAEADSAKIRAVTAPGFRFYDPLVGTFLSRTIDAYFDLLQERFSAAGIIRRPDVAFFLRGPMDRRSRTGELPFWREAPRIGLTGVSEIKVAERGIIAESVAYDPNLASDTLRRAFA